MRFSRLDFRRYGHFNESSVGLPRAPLDLHLVIGPNESGKTTARAAISDLLFGFGSRTPYAFLHDTSALRVGAEIERGADGLCFYRRKGTKETLRDEVDRPLRDDALAPYLPGADREYFERMFSLDQPSLVAGAKSMLDAGDDVARMLFQASAGLRGLGDVLKALEKEADGLWAPRKSKDRAYYQALERFENAQRTLKETIVRASDWDTARKTLERAEQKLVDAVDRYGKARNEKARLDRIARSAPLLRELQELSSRLEQAGEIARLPDDAAATWMKATEAIAGSRRREEDLRSALQEAEKALEGLTVDEAILARETAVSELQKNEATYSRHPIDLEKRRAEVTRLEDEARKQAHALGLQVASIDAIASRMPSKLLLRRLTELVTSAAARKSEYQATERALVDARRKLEAAIVERDRLSGEGAPSPLRDAVAQARGLGNTEARRAELSSALQKAQNKLDRLLLALHPFSGDMGALFRARPPDAAVASRFQNELTTFAERQRDAVAEGARLRDQLREAQLREDQVQRDGAPIGPEQVQEAREQRRLAWQLAKAQLLSPTLAADPAALSERVEATTEEADRLADRRYDASEAWAKLLEIRNGREMLETKLAAVEARLSALAVEQERAREAWRAILASAGIPEILPEAMPGFAKLRNDALEESDAVEEARGRLAGFAEAEANIVEQLRAALLNAGESEAELRGLAFPALLGRGEALAKSRDEERARRAQMTEQLRRAKQELPRLDEAHRNATEALGSWTEQWQRAIAEAGLPASLEPSEGAAVVDGLGELGAKLEKIAELRNERIEKMERDLIFLRDRALEVAREVAFDPSGLSSGEVIQALASRLEAAKHARGERQRARDDIAALKTKLASAIEERRTAEARLAPLHAIAKTESDDALRAAIERSEWHREQTREIHTREQALRQVADGLSREQLESEAAAEDFSTLAVRLDETTREFDDLAHLRESLAAEAQAARSRFDAIGGSEHAALAETQRQEALASMGAAVERWIRIRTAAKTLKWAIERFRQQQQDPLLQRASAIFGTLTLGEFEKLVVDFDERDQPRLVGIRRSTNAHVPITGMSTGTADQLFLALRIAALELHLDSRPALPFIADDIFIHFDDARAAAGFRVLADLSRRTQVIFFTHHEHLVEVARSAIDGDLGGVIRLGS